MSGKLERSSPSLVNMRPNVRLLFLCLLGLLRLISWASATEITLLYTGETHAALVPCDCPLEPYGGLPRRATVIRQERQRDPALLLVDAGGAFAGGLFDEYSEGETRDRQRTALYLQAMERMGYAALAAGDEEFRYGTDFLIQQALRVPILSANVFLGAKDPTQADRRLLPPYVIREVKGVRIAILGLTTPDLKRQDLPDLTVRDPIAVAQDLVPQLRKQADVILVLSHLGEALSRELVRQVPGIDLVINAHRKLSRQPYERIGRTHWLQFNYQARKLGKFVFEFAEGEIRTPRFEEIPLDESVPDDPEMAALVEDFRHAERGEKRLRLDLYVGALCPYAPAAERAVAEVVRRWGRELEWHLYFIVWDKDGQLRAQQGEEELQESLVQAAIARYYPDRIWAYLEWRHQSIRGTPWQEGAAKLGLHRTRIEMALKSGQAEQILREHAWRVARLRVRDSPTLFINNQLYTGTMQPEAILRALCAKLGEQAEGTPCADLPRCVTDVDCEKQGFIGVCVEAGTPQSRCEYEKAVRVPLTVIRDPSALLSNEEDILKSARKLFPGVDVSLVDAQSPQGQALIRRLNVQRLPAYLFGPEILKARRLTSIKSTLRRVEGGYMPDPASVGASLWIARPRKPYRLDVFVQPLSPGALRAWLSLKETLEGTSWTAELHYLLEYQAAEEEAARQRVIRVHFPETFEKYLQARLKTLESSYWEDALLAVGLDPRRIKRLARERGEALLEPDRRWAQELNLTGEMAVVVENREAVSLRTASAFRALIQRVTGR